MTTGARTTMDSPVGRLTLVASDTGLREVVFGETDGRAAQASEHPVLQRAQLELAEYFDGRRQRFDVPLQPVGTPFQRACWDALLAIPYGETRSYAQQALMLGGAGKTRAVGGANARNRLAIIVPCHRVVASDGTLGGYAGGLDVKRHLLELEARTVGKAPSVRDVGQAELWR